MPLDAKAQNQRAMEAEFVRTLAELALQHQKGTRAFKLSDLQSDEERAIFIASALEAAPILFSPESQCDRAMRLNALRGEVHAYTEKEQHDIDWQARQDAVHFGGRSSSLLHFGSVRPGCCYICKGRIEPLDAFVLELSATLKADVHGSCCQDESKYELLSSFAFRLKGGTK